MTQYDPDRLVSWIQETDPSIDDRLTLGAKALGLKHLVAYGYRVPDGFILTTELFGALPALAHAPLYDATAANVRAALRRLEQRTQLRLGDPERLLTLSIRSGAAISMPGLMDTFVNVGLNDELTEALARRPGAHLVGLGLLPALPPGLGHVGRRRPGCVRRAHADLQGPLRRSAQKLDFTAAQMRELALGVQGPGPGAGGGLPGRSGRSGAGLHPQGARLVGRAPRPASTGRTPGWRRSGARL